MSTVRPRHLRDEDLRRHLEAWVARELISTEEAEAIRAFEVGTAPSPRRVPLVTEVLAYLGAGLAIAAGVVLLARVWRDLSPGARAAVLGGVALVAFLAGLVLRDSEEPAFDRVAGVLWLIAAGGAGACAGVTGTQVLEVSDRLEPVWIGAVTTIVAAALYGLRPHPLQQVALLVGLLILVTGAWQSPIPIGLSWWVIGGLWIPLGWAGRLEPRPVALVLGASVVAIGPALMAADASAVALSLGIVTAAGLLTASVAMGEPVLLGPGALALFGYLLATITRYLGQTVGMPVVLALAGIALLAVAFVTTRLRTMGRRRVGAA